MRGRMQKNIRSLLLIMVGVGLPHVLFAQATLFTILSMLVVVFTSLIRVGLAIALVVFMWGLVMFIAQSGNEQAREVGNAVGYCCSLYDSESLGCYCLTCRHFRCHWSFDDTACTYYYILKLLFSDGLDTTLSPMTYLIVVLSWYSLWSEI